MYLFKLSILGSLAISAAAAVIPATSGSATINNVYATSESSSFQLTGPNLNLTASGGSLVGYNTTQTLNNAFSLSLSLLISDNGYESGSGTAGGTSYPSVAFSNSNTLVITALAPITLTSGNLTMTTAATLSGTLAACTTASICINGGGVPAHPFDVSIAPINGILTVTYANINPPMSAQYALRTAVFTPVPEPATWIAGFGILAFVGVRGVAKLRKLSSQ